MAIERFEFNSGNNGTKLLVFGAIHGDEVCGPAGIHAVMEKLTSGAVSLVSGKVTFVPVCNTKAYEQNVRCIEDDLNRVFRKTEDPKTVEAAYANELCGLVDEADVLLDLHSSTAPGPVNAFIDYPTAETNAFVATLGPEYEILGWPNVYSSSGANLLSFTTERYAHENGKIGTTFECGQHADASAVSVAEKTILRALGHFGIVESDGEKPPAPMRVVMKSVIVCEDDTDTFLNSWKHLQKVPAGTCIARRANGEELCVDTPSVVIFPYKKAVKGDEWFYLGIEESQ